MRASSVVCFLLLLVLPVATIGCDDDEPITEADAIAWCVTGTQTYCERVLECSPSLADLIFGVSDPGDCYDIAQSTCSDLDTSDPDDGSDDGCTELPTNSQVGACVDQIEGASCEDLLDFEFYGSGACAALDVCSDG